MGHKEYWTTLLQYIIDDDHKHLGASLGRGRKDIHILSDVLNERNSLLHIAAMGSGPGVVAALLEAGADPTIKNDSGLTPLDVAHDDENKQILATAVRARADLEKMRGGNGWAQRVQTNPEKPPRGTPR